MAKKNKGGKKKAAGGRISTGAYAGLKPRDAALIQSQTNLAYGPKQTALSSLVSAAKDTKGQDIRAAKTTARSLVRSANKAVKPTRSIFNVEQADANDIAANVRGALSELSTAADPIKAATESTLARQNLRIGSARQRAMSDLVSRKVEARAGREGSIGQARAEYKNTMRQLGTQLVALAGERGDYAATQAGTLQSERAKTRADIRKSKIAAQGQKDVAGIYASAKGKGGSGGGGSGSGDDNTATPTTIRGFRDDLQKAIGQATQLQAGQRPKNPKSKKEWKRPPAGRGQAKVALVSDLGIDDTVARVALDVVYGRRISPANVRMLRNFGITPSKLGISQYLPGNRDAAQKKTRAKGNKAQQNYYEKYAYR